MKNLVWPALLSVVLFLAPAARGAEAAAEKSAEPAAKPAEPAAEPAEAVAKPAETGEAKAAHADVKAATGIENRKPTGEATTFAAGTTIYVWSQVFDAKDKVVEHVWKRDGQEFRRAKFNIGGVRWSVNSRQQKAKKGAYVVEVVSGDDKLGEVGFTVE